MRMGSSAGATAFAALPRCAAATLARAMRPVVPDTRVLKRTSHSPELGGGTMSSQILVTGPIHGSVEAKPAHAQTVELRECPKAAFSLCRNYICAFEAS